MHSHVTCKFFTQWFFELQENHFVPFIYFSIHKQCRFKSSCYLQPKRSRPCSRLWLTGSIRYFPGVSRRQRLTCLHGGLAEPGLTGPSGSDLACSKHKVCGGPLYVPGQGVPVEPNREDPVHAARSCFLTCRSCYSPAKVWLSRFLTLLFRTESTNVTFTPPDIVPGCHIMYNISMLSRACWLLLWFCTGSHADIMEKLVDKKQTVLDFMKAVNLLVKMKSGFTVFWGQLLTRFSRSRRQLTVHP